MAKSVSEGPLRYRLGGAEWLAALHAAFVGRVLAIASADPIAARALSYSICEVYENAPLDLAGADRRIAWHCSIRGESIDFRIGETDDVGLKIVLDYAVVSELARYDTRGESDRVDELARRLAAAVAEGKAHVRVLDEAQGRPLGSALHDVMARLTA